MLKLAARCRPPSLSSSARCLGFVAQCSARSPDRKHAADTPTPLVAPTASERALPCSALPASVPAAGPRRRLRTLRYLCRTIRLQMHSPCRATWQRTPLPCQMRMCRRAAGRHWPRTARRRQPCLPEMRRRMQRWLTEARPPFAWQRRCVRPQRHPRRSNPLDSPRAPGAMTLCARARRGGGGRVTRAHACMRVGVCCLTPCLTAVCLCTSESEGGSGFCLFKTLPMSWFLYAEDRCIIPTASTGKGYLAGP